MTDGKNCPACGKPTAGYVPCPHCGADPRTRITIKFALVICAIVLAFGVVYFAMHLATIEPQPIAIASIDRWMDYSYVWLEGDVSYGPQYGATSISFEIYDGSGKTIEESSIRVEIYDPAFKVLIDDNKVPRVGDHVKLFGQLRVFLDGSTEFRVSSSKDVEELTRAEAVSASIGEVVAPTSGQQSLLFKRVTLEGTVTGVRPLSSAKIYTLQDNVGDSIEMYVHNGLGEYIENRELDLKVLQTVSVSAGVSQYGGTPQLAISSFDEITVTGESSPIVTSIDNIDTELVGEFVKVSGKIVFVEIAGAADSLEIEERSIWLDNKTNPKIKIEEDVFKLISAENRSLIVRGYQVELVGKVENYAGAARILFIGPQEPSLQAGTDETPLVENFASITENDADNLVMVSGSITYIDNVPDEPLPSNRKLTLENNGESIKIWVPNTIYERLVDPPEVGDSYQVVGKVTTRGGELVIQPGVMSDLQVS